MGIRRSHQHFSTCNASAANAVEIEYWQYFFDARVTAMEQLIENFQAANPDITVKMTHFPYADYRTKVAAAIPGGRGAGRGAALLRLAERLRRRRTDPAITQ